MYCMILAEVSVQLDKKLHHIFRFAANLVASQEADCSGYGYHTQENDAISKKSSFS